MRKVGNGFTKNMKKPKQHPRSIKEPEKYDWFGKKYSIWDAKEINGDKCPSCGEVGTIEHLYSDCDQSVYWSVYQCLNCRTILDHGGSEL